MKRLPTRLPGLVLLAPAVHGDARGFFIETFRADAWAAEGIPTDFVQDNHSRSRRGTLRGIHFQTHPGQGKLVRVARGRVLDVVVDLRRGSPTFGEWESVELDDERGHSSTSRSASGTASACSPRPPTSSTSAPPTTTRRPSGDPLRRPRRRRALAGGHRAALLGARPRRAAARRRRGLAAVPVRSMSGRALRAEPDRHAAPRQPAHGAARVAVRALGRRALPGPDGGPRPGPRGRRVGRAAARATCARSGSTGTARSCFQSNRHDAYEDAIARLLADDRLYECFCTRAEIRAAASAPHGPLPEGAYPGTCLRLTERPSGGASAAAGARRRCACAPERRGSRSPTACTARRRASSTTSSSAATTARPPTTSP